MGFFNDLDPRLLKGLKFAGIALVAVIVLSAISTVTGRGDMPSFVGMGRIGGIMQAPSMGYESYSSNDMAVSSKGGYAVAPSLSTRNAMPIVPGGGYTTGSDAEEFEVTDYNAMIETRDADDTCSQIASLKSKPYVIFENSNLHDRGCYHTFKVSRANVPEILEIIKSMDPRDLNENIRTIKEEIADYTSQTDILIKKLAAIDQTLKSALAAYDEITDLATRSQDASSLAKIIDSKIQMIERLTQEKININTQLEYLARAKGQQLDRLDYTYFHINVYENKYIDAKNIKDSWKAAIREFVGDVNRILQAITVGVVALVLFAVQYLIYIFILVFAAKYAWKAVKGIWTRQ